MPDRGVNGGRDSHLINPRQWVTMQQMRARLGVVSNLPGWLSLLSSGSVGAYGTLIDEFQMADGTTFILFGGPTKLYRWDPGPQSLIDITGAIVLAPTRDSPWFPFVFDNSYYVTNLVDGLHKWTGTGDITAPAGAPKARAGGILNDHICLLNVNDGTSYPQRFQWAAEGTDTTWVAAQNNDAGAFDLIDTNDVGVALHHLGNDLIAYKERSIVPMTYIGGNEVFGKKQSVVGVGTIGPNAIATLSDRHIFMGSDSFYEYEGGVTVNDSIADDIRERVYTDLHRTLRNRSQVIYNEEHDEITFLYPSLDAITYVDKAVTFNVKERTWYGPFPIKATVAGYSFSTYLTKPLLMFINNDGVPMHFGRGQSDNGTNIERVLESGDHSMADGSVTKYGQPVGTPLNSVFQVNMMHIEVENLSGGDVEFYLGHRMELNDDLKWDGPFTIRASRRNNVRVPVRSTGRWFRTRFIIPQSREFTLFGYQYEHNYVGVR